MKRSSLILKATPGIIASFERDYKKKYKEENGKQLEGNVIKSIIKDIVTSGGTPNLCDIIPLIKVFNNDCTDEQAYDIYSRWLDTEGNTDKGIRGAFCELCGGIALDWPLDPDFTNMLKNMESILIENDKINKMQEESLNKLKYSFMNMYTNIIKENTENTKNDTNIIDENTDIKDSTLG